MKVTLYRFVGDSDTANKLLKNCTVVYDKEVIPYGAFNPNGASFRLDTLHDVNYAKFTYNSHDYYGYVAVATDSKGIYNYSITTDPLTTAWYAGCFNTGNLCKYSDLGTGKFFDDRATYSPDLNYEYLQVKAPSTDFRVILVIARSYGFEASYGKIYNPLYDVYSMSYGDWNTFADASTGTIYEDYRDCIFRIYAIPSDEISQSSSSIVYTKVSQVGLYGTAKKKVDKLYCPQSSLPQLDDTYQISTPSTGLTYSESWLPKFTKVIDKPINSWRRQNIIKLYVEDMGYISFKYSDVAKGVNITSIGYRKSYDFVSGLQRATLVINDIALKDYFIQGNIANSVPYFDAEHRQSFNERLTGMLSAGIGLASGIMSLAGSGVGAAVDKLATTMGKSFKTYKVLSNLTQTPGVKGAKKVWGDVHSTIMDNAFFDFFNSIKGTGGGAATQIAASNVISSINGMNNTSQGNGYTLNGGNSGSLDLPSRQGSFIIWQEAPPHNLADIEGKFGKPDGLVRVVGNMTGWVQTEACHLPSNGLPFDIVDAAEKASDSGFRIVT